MTTTLLLKVAAVISLLFAAGHTRGGLRRWSLMGENEVLSAMTERQFDVMGVSRSYLDFFMGFGWSISIATFRPARCFGLLSRARPYPASGQSQADTGFLASAAAVQQSAASDHLFRHSFTAVKVAPWLRGWRAAVLDPAWSNSIHQDRLSFFNVPEEEFKCRTIEPRHSYTLSIGRANLSK